MKTLKNSSFIFVANILYVIANWAVLKVFIVNQRNEWVGEYSLTVGIIVPLILLTGFQLKTLTITNNKEKSIFILSDFLIARILTSTIIFIFLNILYVLNITGLSYKILLSVGLTKIIESISDIILGYLQKGKHFSIIAISIASRALLLLLAAFLSVLTGINWIGFLLYSILLVAWIYFFEWHFFSIKEKENYLELVNDIKLIKTFKSFEIKLENFFKLVRFSGTLGIVSMLTSYTVNIPRYIVSSLLGTAMLGIYSAISYLWFASCFLCIAIGEIYLPYASDALDNNNQLFFYTSLKRFSLFSLLIGVSAFIFCYWFGEELLTILFSSDYVLYKHLLLLFVVFIPLSYLNYFLSLNLTLLGNFNEQLLSNIIFVILLFPLTYILVKRFGLNGGIMGLISLTVIQISFYSFKLNIHLNSVSSNGK